ESLLSFLALESDFLSLIRYQTPPATPPPTSSSTRAPATRKAHSGMPPAAAFFLGFLRGRSSSSSSSSSSRASRSGSSSASGTTRRLPQPTHLTDLPAYSALTRIGLPQSSQAKRMTSGTTAALDDGRAVTAVRAAGLPLVTAARPDGTSSGSLQAGHLT